MKLKNAPNQEPQVFYGLHFAPGVCTHEQGDKTIIVYISPDTAKRMDPTMEAKPFFVKHVDEVNLETVKENADGWVSESFFNEPDGMHWAKFTAVSDDALEAVRNGWFLSNCFRVTEDGPPGDWHGVPYAVEAVSCEYEHLAIVPVPRYKESIILTPEEFKDYNEKKTAELLRLKNSVEEAQGGPEMFKLFNREPVKDADKLSEMSVELPKSKVEVKLSKLINEADDAAMKKDEPVEAKPEHTVTLKNGEKTTVGDLLQRHEDCYNALESMKTKHPDEFDESGKIKEENAVGPETDVEAKKKLEGLAGHEEEEIEAARQKNALIEKNKTEALKLKNAEASHRIENPEPLEIGMDQFARGATMYGTPKK